MRILLQWLKSNRVMLINASSLIGTTAVTSILGFAYWWIAARNFSPNIVGIASASISAMVLLGNFCLLGLGTLLITEIPRQPEKAGSLISTALITVGGIGGCVGIVFAVIASHLSPGFGPLGTNFFNMIIFASGVSFSGMSLVLDASCIGLLFGGLQFWRNLILSIIKLILLFAVSLMLFSKNSMAIYTTWAIGNGLSFVALGVLFVVKKGRPDRSYLPQWGLLRKLGFAAIQHHLLNLTLQAPVLILPVLVTSLLSSKMNAWFYVAWMIANVVFLVPNSMTIVLHAMNSAQQSTLGHKARMTLSFGFVFCVIANCLLLLATTQILGVFGKVYAEQAAWTLRILTLAAFPLIIKYHYIAICRIQDRIASAMLGMLPGGMLELGAAVLGAHLGGLTGLSIGWVVAIYIEAGFMLPTVCKTVLSSPSPALTTEQLGVDAFSLLETFPFPAIPQTYGDGMAIWQMETSLLPFVKPTSMGETDIDEKPAHRYKNKRSKARRFSLKPVRLERFS